MRTNEERQRICSCKCKRTLIKTIGDPIIASACYCKSCLKAGKLLSEFKEAPTVLTKNGGTYYHMQRKDQVEFLQGKENLIGFYLNKKTSTRRVVARCCNTPMFLEFRQGHWLSLYTNCFETKDQVPIEIRTMTIDCLPGVSFSDSIPSPKKHNFRFMWNLFRAWMQMGFKAPKLEIQNHELCLGSDPAPNC